MRIVNAHVISKAFNKARQADAMAAAAEMYALLYMHKTREAIAHIISAESRGHGLSYLSGDAGKQVARKWAEFISAAGVDS